jgi:acetyl-CoA C-acetyltransferase
MNQDTVVIVGARRTPMGAFQGALAGLTAPELGATAIASAVGQAGLQGWDISEVIMGCVLPAGLGQAPARQASLGAGMAREVPATTVNKMCGSGMKAVMLATDQIRAGSADIMVAGGMESMSNAPYLLEKARGGIRMGHARTLDHMFIDGLEDAYDRGRLMGTFAEDTAEKLQFTRVEQDNFALESLSRARRATDQGDFRGEIAAVSGKHQLAEDETPLRVRPDKIPHLKPAFREGGTVTAANSSSISDGAAALVLMRLGEAERRGIQPLAAIAGHATHAQLPAWFTTAPIGAIAKLYEKLDWHRSQVDIYEINEAFAVVTLAAMRELELGHDIVNVNGGACALGHPIGASGARILVTLVAALRARGLKRGIASLCIGGGEATAVGLEIIH